MSKNKKEKLRLICKLPPGDVMTLTVAIESLHKQYPDKYLTGVKSLHPAIFHANPNVVRMENGKDVRDIEMHYHDIQDSNQRSVSFINAYTSHLSKELDIPITPVSNRPVLYLEDTEKSWMSQVQEVTGKKIPFWIVNAGIKRDFTAKSWPIEHYQEVVNRTLGKIQWVQIGAKEDGHPKLDGVIDLREKTDIRQLIRLVFNSSGGLGPVTFLQHLCAAWDKPYICLLGGREPSQWVQYPLQHTLSTLGLLSCCKKSACWKSRVVQLGDGKEQDNSICEYPVLGMKRPSAKCMTSILPEAVLEILSRVC